MRAGEETERKTLWSLKWKLSMKKVLNNLKSKNTVRTKKVKECFLEK